MRDEQDREAFLDFWRCLLLCHDVVQVTDRSTGKQTLSGASLDEVTFLETCNRIGFGRFIERSANAIRIELQGVQEEYEILRLVQFTSDRKRMSIVVRNRNT